MKDWTEPFGLFLDRMRANVAEAYEIRRREELVVSEMRKPNEDYEVCPICGETLKQDTHYHHPLVTVRKVGGGPDPIAPTYLGGAQ